VSTTLPRFRAQGFMGGVVPLSEHEQRQLEQIEQALYSEDPKFVHSVRSSDPRVHYKRRAFQAVAGFVLGVGLLLAGVISHFWIMEIAGFVVMLACSIWALSSWRHISGMSAALGIARPMGMSRRPKQRRGHAPQPGLMERLEERWRRRQEGGG
jgi:Protein of unknown function (DUF3040)